VKQRKSNSNKVVRVRGTIVVAAETTEFSDSSGCYVEGVTIGADKSLAGAGRARFEDATDLGVMQSEADRKAGLVWEMFRYVLKVDVDVTGILKTSRKPKWGHLNAARNLFLVQSIIDVGDSRLFLIGDEYKKSGAPVLIHKN